MFDIFQTRADAHVRKAREYLQQANVARIDHQVAAEHHAALASMYAQRVNWLEQELANAASGYGSPLRDLLPKKVEAIKRTPRAILNWPGAPKTDNTQVPESA